ncbi:YmfQ family protein [Candidatus Pantoea formicae]|uniref:YmfQ family protein n=1 Tax=Candidatus Pantoea formicae TaxID=2608355 RepID=UPI003EDA2ECC
MSYRDLLARLLPPVAYHPDAPRINAELTAEGNAFDTAEAIAEKVLAAVTPFGADELLTDWERVLALTPATGDTWQQRLSRVLIKLAETGGLSREYFIRLAGSLGYTITIDEPQPFRTGSNSCGDTLYDKRIIFTWVVTVYGLTAHDELFESTLTSLKPAHTFVSFVYDYEFLTPLYLDGSFALDGAQPMTGYAEQTTA